MGRNDAHDELLQAAIDYVAEHGISDLSLRTLAGALGTSHRMLIHHFGTKEELWVQIVRAVEERERAGLLASAPTGEVVPAEAMRANWLRISSPELWANERLFFELYGQALQGRAHAVDMLDGIVDDWVEPIAQLSIAAGMPEQAHARARLGVAVTRGLLLDLLATKDVEGVNAAMEMFIELHDAWLNRSTEPAPRSRRARKAR